MKLCITQSAEVVGRKIWPGNGIVGFTILLVLASSGILLLLFKRKKSKKDKPTKIQPPPNLETKQIYFLLE